MIHCLKIEKRERPSILNMCGTVYVDIITYKKLKDIALIRDFGMIIAEQSRAEQSRAEQSRAEQSRAERN
jgi:hypothetical protein